MRKPRTSVPWLEPGDAFPPVEDALPDASGLGGLLAAGGDLAPERLLDAYRRGIFPWYSERQPILWWSPDPRMVLAFDDLRVTRSLARTLRKAAEDPRVAVRFDTAFDAVVAGCRGVERDGQSGTWITDEIAQAYGQLHRLGHAHSFETWRDGRLIGGGYGIAIGRMFYGESMYARETDASKIALVGLVALLARAEFELIDCQQNTRHLAGFGAREIPRADFTARIEQLTRCDGPVRWADGIALQDVAAFADRARVARRARHAPS